MQLHAKYPLETYECRGNQSGAHVSVSTLEVLNVKRASPQTCDGVRHPERS